VSVPVSVSVSVPYPYPYPCLQYFRLGKMEVFVVLLLELVVMVLVLMFQLEGLSTLEYLAKELLHLNYLELELV
jgi:hypothetical protein